jgi:predicted nucleic acid-binding protein
MELMKNMVILIDTNVVIDFLSMREDFYRDAEKIFDKCADGELSGYIAINTISDVFFILRKAFSVQERKSMLYDLCEFVKIVGLEHEDAVAAIQNEKFDDLEDCLQSKCAEKVGADYIITRNIGDFINSKIPATTPSNFMKKRQF